jgi:hypothetical protein
MDTAEDRVCGARGSALTDCVWHPARAARCLSDRHRCARMARRAATVVAAGADASGAPARWTWSLASATGSQGVDAVDRAHARRRSIGVDGLAPRSADAGTGDGCERKLEPILPSGGSRFRSLLAWRYRAPALNRQHVFGIRRGAACLKKREAGDPTSLDAKQPRTQPRTTPPRPALSLVRTFILMLLDKLCAGLTDLIRRCRTYALATTIAGEARKPHSNKQ